MKSDFKNLVNIQDKFLDEFNVMKYANSCGIGVPDIDKKYKIGLSLTFETEEDMNNFPYKESTYEGYPVYKRICGKIVAY